ncbi:MAG: mannan endo-1,4-beta-mannosidase, partial [Sphingobacteriales bacterium]
SSSRVACGAKPGTLSEDMITAHKQKNVILSPLWHWNSPTKLKDAACNGSGETAWYSGFYTNATNFNLKAALADTNSADYKALIADIDIISAELQKFSDAGIPLLWRPLHEAQGAWFWWGASGPEELKALWRIMYNRMTIDHKLNNLIWVFTNTGDSSAEWYPGNDVVDIVGYDGYDGKNAGNPFKSQFATLKDRYDGKKIVALTETGTIPNVATMRTENAYWSYFVTWNSGGDYGPANADPAITKATYADENTVNLQDIPGGKVKTEAGLYSGFEMSTQGFGAQVGWSDTSGITTSTNWSSSGSTSLGFFKDLVALGKSSDIVFQTYPTGGLDITGKTSMTIKVHAADAGTGVNAQLFVKDKDYVWKDNGTVNLVDGSAVLTLDVTGINMLSGFGVRFNGVDGTSTAAKFYIDEISLSDGSSSKIIYDFEPATDGFGAQIGWSDTSGITTSTEWAKAGMRSLALYKNLSALSSVSDIVLQAYPEGGIDVKDKSTLTVSVHAMGAGNAVNAKLFVKDKDYVWKDGGAVDLVNGSADLTVDVSTIDLLSGLGVDFNGADGASTNAKFFIDSITLDGKVLYSFEGTGDWEFQNNWTGTTGIHLSTDWAKSGSTSIAGTTQLKDGDDNVVLQLYPKGGILRGDITKLKVSVHVKDAGPAVKAQLFAKDKNFTWKDGGAVDLVGGSADLELDISAWDELSGLGVRFMGPVNSATESTYYIDDVIFE